MKELKPHELKLLRELRGLDDQKVDGRSLSSPRNVAKARRASTSVNMANALRLLKKMGPKGNPAMKQSPNKKS